MVSNATYEQREDGSYIVDVYYDLENPSGGTISILMEASEDGGESWDLSCNLISGEVGSGITAGENKHIVWDFGSEHPNYYEDRIKVRIRAYDGIVQNIPCPGVAKVYYEGGPNSDERGAYYNTVQIGDQCWLKENLNVGTMIESNDIDDNQTDNGIMEKYCYDNNPVNCSTYGGLYQWDEAMQYSSQERARGICPTGWHLPTLAEFEGLKAMVNNDGNALKAVGQGSESGAGTNTSGFSAVLASWRFLDGNFYDLDYDTYFWSSMEFSSSSGIYMYLFYDFSNVVFNNYYKVLGFSVRCLMD